MRIALGNLDIYRPTVGAAALGMGWRAFSLALEHARSRQMFGRTLAEFQVTQFKLAEMKVAMDAASLLVYRAAWLADHAKEKTSLEASAAKYFATETAQKVVDQSLQITGEPAFTGPPGSRTSTVPSGPRESTRARRRFNSW